MKGSAVRVRPSAWCSLTILAPAPGVTKVGQWLGSCAPSRGPRGRSGCLCHRLGPMDLTRTNLASSGHRLPDEGREAFEAFVAYRDMRGRRSQRAIAGQLGKSETPISRWSSRHRWRARLSHGTGTRLRSRTAARWMLSRTSSIFRFVSKCAPSGSWRRSWSGGLRRTRQRLVQIQALVRRDEEPPLPGSRGLAAGSS